MKRIDAGKQFWADFPMVGYNADGLFIDVNMFHFSLGNGEGNNEGSGFHNARVYALDMAHLNDVTTTDLPADQFYTMYPAVMHGAQPGTPMEFVVSSGLEDMTVGRLTNTFGGQPEDFQFTQLPLGRASAFGKPAPPSQPGEGDFRPGVDSLLIISKVAAAAWRDNSLVVAQTIGHPQGGLNTNAVRWYEIDTAGPKPQLQYFGTIFRRVGVDVYHPSIDINAAGDLGLTFMQSSGRPGAFEFPSMYVGVFPRSSFPAPPSPGHPAIRVRNDPATNIFLAKAGVAPLNSVENNTSPPRYRAGDYSSTAVDPVDNTTFWAANEYATDQPRNVNGTPFRNWGTFIQSFGVTS